MSGTAALTRRLRCAADRAFDRGFVVEISQPVVDPEGFITSRLPVYALALDEGTKQDRQDGTRASSTRAMMIDARKTDSAGNLIDEALVLTPSQDHVVNAGLHYPVVQPGEQRPTGVTLYYNAVISTVAVPSG